MTEIHAVDTFAINNFSDFDKIYLSEGEYKDVLFGFSASFFYEGGSTKAGRIRGNKLLSRYRDLFPKEVNHFHPFGARHRRKIDKIDPIDYYNKSTDKISDAETYGAGLYGFNAEYHVNGATPYTIGNVGSSKFDRWSYVDAYFRASWVEAQGYEFLLKTLLSWCDILKPSHGTFGVSVLFDTGGFTSRQCALAFPVFTRFPGMDVPRLGTWTIEVGEEADKRWIRTINWLTILDDAFVEELGGLSHVEAELGKDCPIHKWNGGIIIQAGAEPQLGDVNRGDVPEAYRKVARLTKPIRFDNFVPSTISIIEAPKPFDHHEETVKWFHRFD
ncbi:MULTISPECIES: type VI immunity family protein [Rhizobium/Agrobacterium group]|nr:MULTISPECIES: type VI immunity family protein [Rhizobium/Agrobacterium group]MCF1448578.1 DUF3396 domain-containing protein [Allorhizobium ampelinum]MCF1494169.1 DUF3396 domain-containing protein [Allorhizobium ampelinum]MUO30059.1 DUF3396 domain-containing protein [Agrobacterium vitis]MUO45462.1 DUF3396 domain-containing protein [Agrobacterium vitis]MUP12842.1 DUF3396 domain-containing protein [Agrobacterium vitis]